MGERNGRLVKNKLKTCKQLLQEFYDRNETGLNPVKLRFEGVWNRDVYNITAPFADEDEIVIAGRVEPRDSEHSQIVFFVEKQGVWVPRENMPELALQDPFVTRIGEEIVLGGVQIFPHPVKRGFLSWRTVMYKGKSLRDLTPFFSGPVGMKDLRLVELADGSIAVFTRTMGKNKGGRGKIGFTRLASLDELTEERVEEAPILGGQFTNEEWGGANEIHVLSGGLVGVLGHIACYDNHKNRHYYPMIFAFDPATGEYSDIELIAVRGQFLPGNAKRDDLADVVFSGGLVRHVDGSADLYAGIGDCEAQRITINDPFLKFEGRQTRLASAQ